MVNPTLLVSISRTATAGGPTPLLLSGRLDGTALGVVEYSPPGRARRNIYATDSPHTHGSELQGSALHHAVMELSWMRVGATTQAQVDTAVADVEKALDQFTYTVTTTVNGGTPRIWAADPGSMELAGKRLDVVTLKHLVPVYAVSIPVYPIAGS